MQSLDAANLNFDNLALRFISIGKICSAIRQDYSLNYSLDIKGFDVPTCDIRPALAVVISNTSDAMSQVTIKAIERQLEHTINPYTFGPPSNWGVIRLSGETMCVLTERESKRILNAVRNAGKYPKAEIDE